MQLSSKNKKIVGALIILVVLFMLYYLNRDSELVLNITNKFSKKPESLPLVSNPLTVNKADAVLNVVDKKPIVNDEFPLKVGSGGNKVKLLQQALNRINEKTGNKYAPLVADGSFGEKTYTAIVTWVGTRFWGPTGLTANNFNLINEQSI